MNPFEVLFCWGPLFLGIGVPVLYTLSLIWGMHAKASLERTRALEHQRSIELRQAESDRRAQLQEMRIAKAANDVTLQDARLELAQLKIRKEKREQGLLAAPFTPDEFQPKE